MLKEEMLVSMANGESLSWRARGALAFILTAPPHEELCVQTLMKKVSLSEKPTGRDAAYAIIKELLDAGYVERKKFADGSTKYCVCLSDARSDL